MAWLERWRALEELKIEKYIACLTTDVYADGGVGCGVG
jgi:hypothetical protein